MTISTSLSHLMSAHGTRSLKPNTALTTECVVETGNDENAVAIASQSETEMKRAQHAHHQHVIRCLEVPGRDDAAADRVGHRRAQRHRTREL